jgi:hypothetical protein
MPSLRHALLLAMAVVLVVPALAAAPASVGAYGKWRVYRVGGRDGLTCYALSVPTASEPRGARRDDIHVMISIWPRRSVVDEIQVVPGYPYRDGEPVWVEVGGRRFEFFSRNDAAPSAAWIRNEGENRALIAALRSGSTMRVTGTSRRGTQTVDSYSLSGIAAALDAARRSCR